MKSIHTFVLCCEDLQLLVISVGCCCPDDCGKSILLERQTLQKIKYGRSPIGDFNGHVLVISLGLLLLVISLRKESPAHRDLEVPHRSPFLTLTPLSLTSQILTLPLGAFPATGHVDDYWRILGPALGLMERAAEGNHDGGGEGGGVGAAEPEGMYDRSESDVPGAGVWKRDGAGADGNGVDEACASHVPHVLLGLHACGDLSPSLLRTFVALPGHIINITL